MKVYESPTEFLEEYTAQDPNEHGFRDVQLVKIVHTSDEDYKAQVTSGEDKLGFQPALLMFINPFTEKTSQVIIKDVSDTIAAELREFFRKQYAGEFPKKFGSFTPDVFDAFTEYPSWEEFDQAWLTRNGKSVSHINLPLLFDHMSNIEYWTRKQTGEKVLNNQRLLVTTYFIPEKKFYRFFIKDVDDAEFERISRIVQGRVGLSTDALFV